jgi:holo-[acyl-carrier protein] synthase
LSLVGVGIDIVAVGRIADLMDRHGQRFLERCFLHHGPLSAGDDNAWSGRTDPAWVAGRWAAKEALLKALGKDVRGIPYRDIEVPPLGSGSEELRLHGRARQALNRSGGGRIHLTISHAGNLAVASVLIER